MRCELSLRALKLAKAAGGHRVSDPFAVVTHIATTPNEEPRCLGRTEEAEDNLSPSWEHVFRFEYELGTPMKLCVQIYDNDKKKHFKLIGSAFFDVGQILGTHGCVRGKKLKQGGTIIARIRRGTSSGELRLRLKGIELMNERFPQKSDPYYEICKRTETDEGFIDWQRSYRSKVLMDNVNPMWPEVVLDVLSLTDDGNLNQPIKIAIFNHDMDEVELIGETQMSVNQLIDASTEGLDDAKKLITLVGKKAKGGSSNSNAKEKPRGKLMVLEAHLSGVSDNFDEMAGVQVKVGAPLKLKEGGGKPNFMDYVVGGCEFNVCVAVDFTGSNGDPLRPGTLHYLDPNGGFNDYERSIVALLNVLSRYDSDKMFSLWGFGARYNGDIHNIFQCGRETLVAGMDGVLQAYRDQFKSGITLADTPTVFEEVIRTASAHAKRQARLAQKLDRQEYTILIILTDGDVEDVKATKSAMKEAAGAPLSIIFIGIGEKEFSGMKFIDDGKVKKKKRDVACFVEFNQHSKHSQKFTSEACKQIPQQLADFYHSKKIAPMPEKSLNLPELNITDEDGEVDLILKFDAEERPSVAKGGIEYHDIFRELLKANEE